MRKLITLGVVPLLFLTACATEQHDSSPDVPSNQIVHTLSNEEAFQLPHGFRNVIRFCDGPDAVYVTSRGEWGNKNGDAVGSSLVVVSNSDHCK